MEDKIQKKDKELKDLLDYFHQHMILNMKSIEPEFAKVVEDNFWDLLYITDQEDKKDE